VPPRTHRPMSHYTRRVRRGRKDSREPPIPKACYHLFFFFFPIVVLMTDLYRVREEELIYVLHKLRELRLWPGSLWAALSESPSKYATEQPGTFAPHAASRFAARGSGSNLSDCVRSSAPEAIDASLEPSELIADAVKRSSRGHVFHFYTLLCEIASVPRKAPNVWITADRLGTASDGPTTVDSGVGSGIGRGHVLSFDARVLARECLKEVGRELGVPR
jgi:hypothetical protein